MLFFNVQLSILSFLIPQKTVMNQKKILKANISRQFFERGQSDAFSSIESFVVEVLESIGAFKSYRRGDAKKHECDIVVEEDMKQIEIVRFLDEKISDKVRYNRKPISEEQALLFEYCNIGYNTHIRINSFTHQCCMIFH